MRLILIILFLVQPEPLFADSCFKEASVRYGVAEALLVAIARVESSLNPNAINKSNRNGSEDIGIMQINSWWLPKLKNYGIEREDLFDRCTNINVGAWIMAGNIKRYGYTWKAVGFYNSSTPRLQNIYIRKVARALKP